MNFLLILLFLALPSHAMFDCEDLGVSNLTAADTVQIEEKQNFVTLNDFDINNLIFAIPASRVTFENCGNNTQLYYAKDRFFIKETHIENVDPNNIGWVFKGMTVKEYGGVFSKP